MPQTGAAFPEGSPILGGPSFSIYVSTSWGKFAVDELLTMSNAVIPPMQVHASFC
jgi:hypothetical protein